MIEVYSHEENRRLFLAIAISLLLHLVLFISTQLRLNFSWPKPKKDIAQPSDIIRFDLIHAEPPLVMETPLVDKEESPRQPTNIISDKDIIARDMLAKEENLNESPYREGKSKIKELRESLPGNADAVRPEIKPQVGADMPQITQPSPLVNPHTKDFGEGVKEEKSEIEMLPSENSPQEISPQGLPQDAQQEQVATLPKDIFRIPLYDDRLSNARGFGEITFSAKKHDVVPYILKMKKKIEEHWAPPVIFTYYGFTSGETVIQFKIMPDGGVKDIKVINEKGDESLKKSSLKAIEDASPFDPIPSQLLEGEKEKYLGITFTFYYIIDTPSEDSEDI